MKVLIRRIKWASSQDFGTYRILAGSKGLPEPLLLTYTEYSKAVTLKKNKIVFQDLLSLNAGQK